MEAIGHLSKMRAEHTSPISYFFKVGEEEVLLNKYLGQKISLTYLNDIKCVCCGKIIPKSYAQGFCFSCLQTSPEADECILRPELCKAHLGISRDMQWSQFHCLAGHYVYLAVTHDLKVGVTRHSQNPTRWIDQGAVRSIIIASTPNRHLAGVIESYLMKYLSDKTNWKWMLEGRINSDLNLIKQKVDAIELLPKTLQKYIYESNQQFEFSYPMIDSPKNIVSTSLDKQLCVEGYLTGIKGQYLIIDSQTVINIRKHTGYKVKIQIG